ncbi:MAG: hypothetical protein Q9182_004772 [Xanthomendoza sp. 2 TL-2023]
MNTVSLDCKKAGPTSFGGLHADGHSEASEEYDDDAEDLNEENGQGEEDAEDLDEEGEEDTEKVEVAQSRARRARQNPNRTGTDKARREAAEQESVQREEARVRANAEREARRNRAHERADTQEEQEHPDAERRAREVEESRRRVQGEQEEGRQREQDESRLTTTEVERADGAPSTDPEMSASTNTQTANTTLPLTQSVNAIVLPELPSSPLRLTDIVIDKASIQRTADEILAIPGIAKFNAEKKSVLIDFLGTLFSPENYWRLRQTIYKIISKTGFSDERMEDVESHGANTSSTSSTKMSDPPEIMANYLQIWRNSLDFTQQTANTGTIVALKMYYDMQSYLYWCQLMTIWRSGRAGYEDPYFPIEDNGGTGHGLYTDLLYNIDANVRPEDAKAVMDFLNSEIERRTDELGIVDANEKRNRTPGLLRVLVAPYLGYTIKMEAGKGQGSRRSKIQTEDNTTRMFKKLWNNINVRGKTVSVLCKGLGRGAVLIVRRNHLNTLGSTVIKLIVPVLVRNHGNVLIPIFRMIHHRFFLPMQKHMRMHYADVGALMQIYSPEGLGRACAAHPQGLKGILEFEGSNIAEGLLALDQSLGDKGSVDATSAREEAALKDEEVDDIFGADELISEQQAAFERAVFQQRDESPRGVDDLRKRAPVEGLTESAERSAKRRE